jgi:hypothetical protein
MHRRQIGGSSDTGTPPRRWSAGKDEGFGVVNLGVDCTWMISRMLPREEDWYTNTPSRPSSQAPANLLKNLLRS